jgi:hypothetical protein
MKPEATPRHATQIAARRMAAIVVIIELFVFRGRTFSKLRKCPAARPAVVRGA